MVISALLVLEDGNRFYGQSIGATGYAVGEVVFNTSMTGYQEILTDPSYSQQIITFTYPHIGNVGTHANDEESKKVHVQGLIIRDLPLIASNFSSEEGISEYLKKHHIVAISDIDTRKLARLIREKGAQSGCIITGSDLKPEQALNKARSFSGLQGKDLVSKVTTKKSYVWLQGSCTLKGNPIVSKKTGNLPYHIVAYDYGVKHNILRLLVDRGCQLTVVPAQTPAQEVLKMYPDGIFLSNGPGDPEPCSYAINIIKHFLKVGLPLFGICLGYQLLALASGAKTIKMKVGHHGANHPVKNIDSKNVMITSQNHGFAVDENTLPKTLRVTHKSLFDGTLQGIHHIEKPAFGFQGHPEASPGPHDAGILFDHFIELIKQYRIIRSK